MLANVTPERDGGCDGNEDFEDESPCGPQSPSPEPDDPDLYGPAPNPPAAADPDAPGNPIAPCEPVDPDVPGDPQIVVAAPPERVRRVLRLKPGSLHRVGTPGWGTGSRIRPGPDGTDSQWVELTDGGGGSSRVRGEPVIVNGETIGYRVGVQGMDPSETSVAYRVEDYNDNNELIQAFERECDWVAPDEPIIALDARNNIEHSIHSGGAGQSFAQYIATIIWDQEQAVAGTEKIRVEFADDAAFSVNQVAVSAFIVDGSLDRVIHEFSSAFECSAARPGGGSLSAGKTVYVRARWEDGLGNPLSGFSTTLTYDTDGFEEEPLSPGNRNGWCL